MADYAPLVSRYAQAYGVRPALGAALIRQESGGNPNAVSSSGAQGLGQLMPSTARALGVTNPFDPEQNIRASMQYLGQHLKTFGGDETKALAAYNAGPGAVQKYGGVPPFKETQNYVRSVMNMAGQSGGPAAPRAPVLPSRGGAAGKRATGGLNPQGVGQLLGYDPSTIASLLPQITPPPPAYSQTAPGPYQPQSTIPPEGQMGPMPGFQGPSDLQRYNDALSQSLGPSPFAAQALQAQSALARAKAYQAGMPDAEREPYDPYSGPAMPTRNLPAIPDRPAPAMSPMAQILGALGGLVSPVNAGALGAAPLAAANNAAQQQYGDRLERFNLATGQANHQYEDAVAARHAQVQEALHNRQQEIDQSRYEDTLQQLAARLAAEAAGAQVTAEGMPGLAAQDQAARQHALAASTIANEINARSQDSNMLYQRWLGEQGVRAGSSGALTNLLYGLRGLDDRDAYNQGRLSAMNDANDIRAGMLDLRRRQDAWDMAHPDAGGAGVKQKPFEPSMRDDPRVAQQWKDYDAANKAYQNQLKYLSNKASTDMFTRDYIKNKLGGDASRFVSADPALQSFLTNLRAAEARLNPLREQILAGKMPLPEGTRMVPTDQTPAQQQVPQTPGLLSGSVTKTPGVRHFDINSGKFR